MEAEVVGRSMVVASSVLVSATAAPEPLVAPARQAEAEAEAEARVAGALRLRLVRELLAAAERAVPVE